MRSSRLSTRDRPAWPERRDRPLRRTEFLPAGLSEHDTAKAVMNIHEYQAREILRAHGVPVPPGEIAETPEEAERIQRGIPGYRMTPAWELGREGWIDRALEGLDGRPVYLTVDVDYFDPSIVPATGTPEPGGAQWWPTLRLLAELFTRARVVACDVVEAFWMSRVALKRSRAAINALGRSAR